MRPLFFFITLNTQITQRAAKYKISAIPLEN